MLMIAKENLEAEIVTSINFHSLREIVDFGLSSTS